MKSVFRFIFAFTMAIDTSVCFVSLHRYSRHHSVTGKSESAVVLQQSTDPNSSTTPEGESKSGANTLTWDQVVHLLEDRERAFKRTLDFQEYVFNSTLHSKEYVFNSILDSKENVFNSTLEHYERTLEYSKRSLEDRERDFRRTLELKDKLLKLTDELLIQKDEMLQQKDKEILQAKGKMTCRGILKYLASRICFELGLSMSTPISNVLANIEDHEQLSPTISCLFDVYIKCKVQSDPNDFYRELYEELCKDIHGAPWNGPGVKMTFTKNSHPEYHCVMVALVEDVLEWDIDG